MKKIRIGIVGYGNIGRGVEKAVNSAPDMELVAVFTRREPKTVHIDTDTAVIARLDDAVSMKDKIDVMILCGGSATDLPEQGPMIAAHFNTVDSFDTHAKIPEYLAEMDKAAKNTTALISVGWDPGLFSLTRLLGESVLPDGASYTFWGRGVSQGHSDAIRRITGVKNAVQYTVPIEDAVTAVRSGRTPELTTRQKHLRECYVVAEDGADKTAIETAIKTMPNYFADYDTTVTFISEDELRASHSAMPHGGSAIRTGHTGDNSHLMELTLKLDSNPEFTGSIMTACARAVSRMAAKGDFGAKTLFDVPLGFLHPKNREEIIKELL